MSQEPFGDAHAQQQPWHLQGPQDWQGYYDPQQAQAQWQQPDPHGQWQQVPPYDQPNYGQPQYDPFQYEQQGGHGQTGYVEGAYLQGQDQGHGAYGGQEQYQPYQQQYPDYGQQPYAATAAPQPQPGEEGLYVPAGAEYSADGYVHIDEPPAEPAPAVEEPPPGGAAEPAARSRAAGRGGDGESPASLVDKVRAAVLTGEHVPSRRALLVRAGAGVAALGVLIAAALTVGAEGGGSASATSGGEPGFTVAHTKVWSAQPVAAQPAGDDTLVGSWLLADAVVRADGSGVHAYDRTAGKPTWSVEPPAAGAVPCGLSAGVNQAGLGAALFRPQADPKSPCTLVAAVDTKTGKTAWTKTLSDAQGAYSARIGVTEDLVIAVGDDHAAAWAAADGKDVWQYTGQGKFCTLSGGVSGKTVLIASSCADSTPADQAVALNTADGKVSWWRGLNNQPKTVTVLSAEPAVVLTTGAKPADDRVFAWGAAGDPAVEIPVVTDAGRLNVTHGTFSATPEVFFEGRTMVAAVTPANGGGPLSAVGYDLDTGKQRWRTPTTAKGTARAVGIDGGSLVLAADERRDQPAHLDRFPLAGGQEAVGGNFPPGTGSLLLSGRVLIGGGQVVVVPEHATNYGTAAGYQAKG
ncbi:MULTISPECIES: outer membrane protein assembly factor BamB family protein [Kitasatospora]|uniref:PQQ-binding-like beta-propeller repeat protein n=1 Tax=Kitasatospora cathayae TaxID=3004092 RepID=A0ABY7Q1D8_9ACTN|nr:PQQ-binding-like beta-propeller repeat protein [Kitasatospora sp. HUAS 3-15]WBP86399.1 PQQ-binding-like beta-propeller repeat protein [Kitasatospora sp. HUAS 3-15]